MGKKSQLFYLISNNKIFDISELKESINLTKINFSFNEISDISKLKELVNLTVLIFGHNE